MAERFGRSLEPNPPAASLVPPSQPLGDDEIPAAVPIPPAGARASAERLDNQVQKAQEQLLSLRRQQELIEKQKRELEELSRRQDDLEEGRSDMIEKLTRSLVVLERQTVEAQKRVEQLRATTESFTTHLRALESINPKSWPSAEMPRELSRALSMVDHAKTEFNQQRGRFASDAEADAAEGNAEGAGVYDEMFGGDHSDRTFLYWLKAGLAFTLPLVLLGFVALCIFVWRTLYNM